MDLSERIKAWLGHEGMRVTDLAKSVGVTWESAYQWTTGKTQPTHENLEAIVGALGLSLAQFYGPVPVPPKSTKRPSKRKAA